MAVAERSAAPPQHALRPVISFHGVSKVYPNGTEALRDVDLAIHQGDFCFLVGPSGAGKSTLVRLLIRDEAPSTGRMTGSCWFPVCAPAETSSVTRVMTTSIGTRRTTMASGK